MESQEPTSRPVLAFSEPPKPAKRTKPPKRPRPDLYTLEQAFDYFYGPDSLNEERCILAVSFLLTYSTQMGNEKLDGAAAHGLGRILKQCTVGC